MSLLDFQHLQQQIKNKLFEIAFKIKCFNRSGEMDISKYAESYFKNLFNIIYKRKGWNFERAIKINQDTYDLYDKLNKICVQITSNNRPNKKATTINSFKNNHLNNGFETLIIFFVCDSKPKSVVQTDGFKYDDLNIVEFTNLIEATCNQSELLKIRDILLEDIVMKRALQNKVTTKPKKSIKETEKEFLRCKKLEKELKEELVIKEYWNHIDKEKIVECPAFKFKDSRFILRSIEDESYPNVDDDSAWCRTFMYDFYERGLLIWLDAVIKSRAIINEKEEWYIEEGRNQSIPEGCKRVNVRILGKLPYKNIVHYQDGDEYYNDYHLFCKYIGIENSPFEEIVYRYQNGLGYYWEDLDLNKQIK